MRHYALVCARAALLAALAAQPLAAQMSNTLYIIDHGLHTALVLARAEVDPVILPVVNEFPTCTWLEIGWGDRAYFMATNVTIRQTLSAVLLPTPSALHVAGFNDRVMWFFPEEGIMRLSLDTNAFAALCAYINKEFETNEHGRAISLGPGWYGDAKFFAARQYYFLHRTCNSWNARALQAAGIDAGAFWSIPAGGFVREAGPYCTTLRKRRVKAPE